MILAFVLSAAAAAPLTVQTEGRLLNADDSPATGQHTFVVTL